jgi:hypothetical protein
MYLSGIRRVMGKLQIANNRKILDLEMVLEQVRKMLEFLVQAHTSIKKV